MQQETQLINEKDYRFKTLTSYTNELKERKNEVRKSFKGNKNKFNRICVANYSVSSIAVRSATTGIVTVVTAIGLPVTIAASVVSGVLGITSIILTSFQKKYHKESIRKKELYTKFSKVITDIDLLIGVGLDKNIKEISADEFKAAKRIFDDAMDTEPTPINTCQESTHPTQSDPPIEIS